MNLKINNNWIKDDIESKALSLLKDKDICMYLGNKGEIYYRLSENEPYTSTKDFKSLENIFKNITGEDIDLSAFYKKGKVLTNENDLEEKLIISPEDLKLVLAEVFNTFTNDEFIEIGNGTYHLNRFKPSVYMLLGSGFNQGWTFNLENSAIGKLILHLVNNYEQRAHWIINWLAYFFQGLKKSQVALVLLGVQGTGKGIFFNEIIKPLFGENFVKTINDKSLNTNYKGSLVEITLFLNLDEISAKSSSSSSIKNFLKALVTNASISVEKKFKNLEKETPIYGQILITSNEPYPLEIEPSDRRFTVFSTGINLAHCNFLDYGNYETLSASIKNELESFAIYLKNYTVDEKMANTALNTPEKYNLIQQYQTANNKPIKMTKLQKNVIEFAKAIRYRNWNLFNTIVDENKFQLKQEIFWDLQNGIFRVENLLPAFKTLYGSRSFGTNSELLRALQNTDFNLFTMQNIKTYTIRNEEKEYLILPQYFFNGVHNV